MYTGKTPDYLLMGVDGLPVLLIDSILGHVKVSACQQVPSWFLSVSFGKKHRLKTSFLFVQAIPVTQLSTPSSYWKQNQFYWTHLR